MRIESTAITLRRREPWEAVDLGFAMLRQWWRPVYGAWAVSFAPAAAIFVYALRDDPMVAAFVLWWLKPVFDRVVLHVLSRAVFGDVVSVARIPADWRDYLKPGLVAGLLWGRVDLARSFDLPVWQLERITGLAGRRRRVLLQRRARYHAVWLTAMCATFESVLILGFLLLSEFVTPAKAVPDGFYESLFGPAAGEGWGVRVAIAYAMAVTVMEPFYVAGGFSLYLNRRTLLEGWDLELELRRCAARAPAALRAAALTLALAAILTWASPFPALAAETAPGKSARQEIAEVLKDPEFPHDREKWSWQLRWPEWQTPDWLRWPEWLRFKWGDGTGKGRFPGETLEKFLEAAFWIAAAAALLWIAWHLATRLRYLIEPAPDRAAAPPVLFGLDILPETLPPDIAEAAARLLRAGQVREALSLLYRGALSSLVHAQGMALKAGDTERDCLRHADALLPREAIAYFAELLAAWEAIAYAGRLPDARRSEGLVASWPDHFGPPREAT